MTVTWMSEGDVQPNAMTAQRAASADADYTRRQRCYYCPHRRYYCIRDNFARGISYPDTRAAAGSLDSRSRAPRHSQDKRAMQNVRNR